MAGDGKVYIGTLEGKMAVLAAGAQWEVLTVNELGEEFHASPAIVDGHLLVRTKEKLYSFAAPGEASDGEGEAVASSP